MRWRGAAALRRAEGRPPLVYGHRGVRGARPENTLAAFELAAAEGADGVELDVRVDRDGELVVLHDPTFERVTGGADMRAASDLPYEEIRRVDVGSGERAPRLTEVLALVQARGLAVNVEMKHDVPDRAAVVRATARKLGAFDPRVPVIVSSFDPRMVAAFGALAPRIPRALLVHRTRWSWAALELARGLGQAAHVERILTQGSTVRRLLQSGLVVNVWTVNDTREALDLAALGVDGIITDVPGLIRAALG
ncbi:glycerophosphodiester phosphodiesterase [Polyangium fumosum]|uniref:Glycerophosphodiester phosphodiesterase n=1 Tax=Polyangium fumosum TaxID=889272 RepID=A0A4V6WQH7_9BACT|nr:glycerophosphodiester phosphodiesterase family protein [Polyangium fumosum]TKC95721.1 glycerophosphodiester phosphodiesterase [Polyangium fumosum]